jgi:hypothetical protein
MSEQASATTEPNDNKLYGSIFIYRDTFDFLHRSLCFYRDLLNRAVDAVNLDPDLKALLGNEVESPRLRLKKFTRFKMLLHGGMNYADERETTHSTTTSEALRTARSAF